MDLLPMDRMPAHSRSRQYLAVIVANLTTLANGVALGWCSPVLPLLMSAANPVGAPAPMTESSASWLGSLTSAGALAATPVYGRLCSRCGRKTLGYVVGLVGVAGWVLVALAPSEAVLLSARAVLGFASSGSCIFCTLYIVETVDDDIRGSMGSMINMFIVMGVLFSYVVGTYVSYLIFNLLCLAVAVGFLLAFWWMPDTPAYLESVGQHTAAQKAREWLRLNKKASPVDTIAIEKTNNDTLVKTSLISELRTNRGVRKAMFIGIGLVLNNQLSGIMAVINYAVTIFEMSGSGLSPNMSAIIVGALQLLAVYITTFLIDRTGRRVLLIGSNITITICLTSLGLHLYLNNNGYDVSSLGWVPITSLCVFVMGFAMGSGTINFIIIGEIFPPHVKDVAVTFCMCLMNFMGFIVARFFMSLIQILGMDGCFWFFASFCLISVFFCYFFVPETNKKSIESILEELNKGGRISVIKDKPCNV